jgi:alpha-tubulin suppressor-like RCC1 family protein
VRTAHGCAVRTGNVGYCWGDNFNGDIGVGTFTGPQLLPLGVFANLVMPQISAGYFMSCGLDDVGNAYCWGLGDSSQLGDGSTGENVPSLVLGGFSYKQISTFAYTTCAVKSGAGDQQVECWGSNEHGQAGIGSAGTVISVPADVSVGGGTFSAISVGATHTCGLKASGVAWCWGTNDVGQLGNGGHSMIDVVNPGAGISGHTFVAISAGDRYTCAIDNASHAYCWGDNTFFQLGNNAVGTEQDAPFLVAGAHTYTAAISAGWFHACAVESGGSQRAFCWGANDNGQIGNGKFGSANDAKVPTQANGSNHWLQISAGNSVTCAITTGNLGFCWGEGDNGEMGNNTSNPINSSPVAVTMP